MYIPTNMTNPKRISYTVDTCLENLHLIMKRTNMSKRKLSVLIGRDTCYIRRIENLSFMDMLRVLDVLEIPLTVFGMKKNDFIKYICAPENSNRILEAVERKVKAIKCKN